MTPIIKDIIHLVADHVIDYCASRFIRVTLIGRTCTHAKGTPYQVVIYIQEKLFNDTREIIKRIEECKSLIGIVFAGHRITSEKQLLSLLVKHRANMDQEIVIHPKKMSFFVNFHFKPTESIKFSLDEPLAQTRRELHVIQSLTPPITES
jgi:hypothetical protein